MNCANVGSTVKGDCTGNDSSGNPYLRNRGYKTGLGEEGGVAQFEK